jgi:hypothetical protein
LRLVEHRPTYGIVATRLDSPPFPAAADPAARDPGDVERGRVIDLGDGQLAALVAAICVL